MKAHIAFVDPKNIEASVTLTMTVERWMDLRKAMDGQPYYGAAQQLRAAVDDLVERVGRRIDYVEAESSTPSTKGCAE
ncbi:hypothetical protein [Shinella kummerowiae]|uniref:hypothetical protein n=1 Tax=Shinella kummerowiae TaxID=417745 RepID=UPI0021B4ED48|nr:hypothetical protein [Shinella kummerowiae]MCT7662359.1 hypothetical protein [Shinella kummerowiae]